MEFNQMIEMKNKDFANACINILKNINLLDEDMGVLLNVEKTIEATNSRYNYTYPILKEVPKVGLITDEMKMANGNFRYYPERHILNGKAYLICNDWYYPSPGKKNVKDNRTPLLKWIFQIKAMRQ